MFLVFSRGKAIDRKSSNTLNIKGKLLSYLVNDDLPNCLISANYSLNYCLANSWNHQKTLFLCKMVREFDRFLLANHFQPIFCIIYSVLLHNISWYAVVLKFAIESGFLLVDLMFPPLQIVSGAEKRKNRLKCFWDGKTSCFMPFLWT